MDPQTLFNAYRDAQQAENTTVDALHAADSAIAQAQAALDAALAGKTPAQDAYEVAHAATKDAEAALLTAALQGVVPEVV